MTVETIATLEGVLACPRCKSTLANRGGVMLCDSLPTCALAGEPFGWTNGRPVLVDFDRSVLDRERTFQSAGASVIARSKGQRMLRRVVDGRNHYATALARQMVADIRMDGAEHPRVLVVGGGEVGDGMEPLYDDPAIRLCTFDIYDSPDLSFVADAHAIPLADGSVDAVWVGAVLEYTLDPVQVVAEITRVLKPGGRLFVNISFTWPVCEQGYDFWRVSPSGLRWLLRDYELDAFGYSSGPGTLAMLALRYLAQSVTGSHKIGQILAIPFLWLRWLDRFCHNRRGLDAAATPFFYGRKADRPITTEQLLAFYDEQDALVRAARRFRN